jgi:hypothetical protein
MFNATIFLEKNTLKGFLFHVALAVLSLVSNVFVIGFIFLSIYYFLNNYNKANSSYARNLVLLKLALYLGSFEIICRILHCNPFIPYEFSKYLFSFILLVVIVKDGVAQKSSLVPFLILLFSILASFVLKDIPPQFENITFNILGPLCVALFLGAYDRFTISDFWPLLNAVLYPLIIVWVYCYFKTPDLETVGLTRNASEVTTGGFGSNQVATALGLAMFIIFIFIFKGKRFTGYFSLDLLVLFGIAFQGLLSFSRGGMLGGALAVVLFIIGDLFLNPQLGKASRSIFYLLILVFSFLVVNAVTSGLILDRYLGKTEGVIDGGKEVDLNSLTTGRYNIFQEDLELWRNNFFAGVGVGNSMYLHSNGDLAHSEFSRLLGEQGLLGGLFFIAWVWFCFFNYRRQPTAFGKIFVLACTTLAFFTTFHAAMRTFITPVLTGFSVLIYTKDN